VVGVSISTGAILLAQYLLIPWMGEARPVATPSLFPVRPVWTQSAGAPPAHPPVIDARAVYVARRDDRLVALPLDGGAPLWTVDRSLPVAPIGDGERVYVARADALEALDAADGGSIWQAALEVPPVVAPGIGGGLVVVALRSGQVVAARAASGEIAWRHAAELPASVPPDVSGAAVVLGFGDGRVVALETRTGQPLWEANAGAAIAGIRVDGNRVFAGSLDNFLYCLDAGSGQVRWRWRTGGDVVAPAAVDRKRVYFVSLDNELRALDRGHGAQRWRRSLRARPLGTPLLLAGTVIVAGLTTTIDAHAEATGKPVGRVRLDAEPSAPALAVPGTAPGQEAFVVVLRDGRVQRFAHAPTKPGEPDPDAPSKPPVQPPPPPPGW
jgi:outer membrane protein assembly factor BamB